MNDLLDRLERLQEKSTSNTEFAELVNVAQTKCRELRDRRRPASSRPLVLHVDAAEAGCGCCGFQKAAASAGRRAALIERLTAEASAIAEAADPEARVRQFCQSLQEFCDALPSDPSTSQFAESAKELDLWRGIMRWQHLAGRWKTLLPRTVKEARTRAGECNAWLEGARLWTPPGSLLRREYLAFLSSVVAREEDSSGDDKEGLRQKLLGLFSGPLVEDVEMFVTVAGERYYVRGKYEWAEGKPIRYIAGVRGEQKSTTIKQADVNAVASHEAPQSAWRRKVREIMAHTTLATWDNSLHEIAEGLRIDRDLDPVLRYYFLLHVLDFAKAGNSILADELDPVIKELQARGGETLGEVDGPQRCRRRHGPQECPAGPDRGERFEGPVRSCRRTFAGIGPPDFRTGNSSRMALDGCARALGMSLGSRRETETGAHETRDHAVDGRPTGRRRSTRRELDQSGRPPVRQPVDSDCPRSQDPPRAGTIVIHPRGIRKRTPR